MVRLLPSRWLAAFGLAALACVAQADDALWKRLQGGGHVVLIRHAVTVPGVGDPPGMQLTDCATQRNLSDAGREEAAVLGRRLRDYKVPVGEVLASPWCRTLETARIVFGREAKPLPALGNLFGRRELEAQQVAALRKVVEQRPARGNLFLVTHGSTTLALTGVSPATAEMVVLAPRGDGFEVVGRLGVR